MGREEEREKRRRDGEERRKRGRGERREGKVLGLDVIYPFSRHHVH